MLVDPRVIRRHVVRHEVEHQLESALLQPLSQACQRRSAAQIAMDGVALDGEPRSADVVIPEVRERVGEFASPFGIRARDRLRRRPRLPHAQEPDPVETRLGQAVELGVRNVIQRRALAQRVRQLGQPDTGVDLVQRRVAWVGHIPSRHFWPVFSPPTCSRTSLAITCPRSVSSRVLASTRPNKSSSGATRPVHPVWWLAPRPAPLSPWKYS